MGNQDTNTLNGDSEKARLTAKEAREYMNKTEECRVVFTSQKDVAPEGFGVTDKDITCQRVVPAERLNSGVLPRKQGSPLVTTGAAEINKDITIVVDGSGRSEPAKEAREDGSRRAARERQEIEDSAKDKFEQNNPNSSER